MSRGDLVLVGDVARHPQHLVPGGDQLFADDGQRLLVDVGQHHRSAGFGERAGSGQAHAGAGAGDQGHLAGEVVARIHRSLLFRIVGVVRRQPLR